MRCLSTCAMVDVDAEEVEAVGTTTTTIIITITITNDMVDMAADVVAVVDGNVPCLPQCVNQAAYSRQRRLALLLQPMQIDLRCNVPCRLLSNVLEVVAESNGNHGRYFGRDAAFIINKIKSSFSVSFDFETRPCIRETWPRGQLGREGHVVGACSMSSLNF